MTPITVSDYTMVKYHDEDRYVTALAWTGGRKLMHLVVQTDNGVVKLSVPIKDQKYCRALGYPLDKGIARFRAIGRRAGMTQGAMDLLDAAESGKVE